MLENGDGGAVGVRWTAGGGGRWTGGEVQREISDQMCGEKTVSRCKMRCEMKMRDDTDAAEHCRDADGGARPRDTPAR